jgi:hypothetical protein
MESTAKTVKKSKEHQQEHAKRMACNSAMSVCTLVRIPVCPEPPLVFSHELLGGLRTGFQVVSPLRIACVFLHSEAEGPSEYGVVTE